ncbi:hypothetical protein ERO13_D01G121360v2, partial [Gossypium hirsutum]
LRPIIPNNACILRITTATEVHDPWAFYLHAILLRQAFTHCRKFPTTVSHRSLSHVSVLVCLLLPHQLANQMRAPPRADSSFYSLAHWVLVAVSSCCSLPKGRFLRVTHPSPTENTTSCPTSSLFIEKANSELSFIPRHNLYPCASYLPRGAWQNRKTHIRFRDNQARTNDFHHVKAFLSHYYGYENNRKSWIQLSTAPIRNKIDYGFESYTHDLTISKGTGVTSLFQFHSRVLMCFHDPLRPRNFDKFLFFS